MLVRNNVPINWENPKNDYDKWVKERIENLLKTKKRLYFERNFTKTDMGIHMSRPPSVFYLIAKYTPPDTGIPEEWKYTEPGLYDKDKNIYAPRKMTARLDIDMRTKQNPELAFFFYEIFRWGAGKVGFILRDWDVEAEEANKHDSIEAEVMHVIYNKLNESDVNLWCYALGVPTDDKGLARKTRDLFAKLKQFDKNKNSYHGYEKFLKDSQKPPDNLKLQAYVSKAFHDKVIRLDNNLVKYVAGDMILCTIPVNKLGDHIQYIAEWLDDNPDPKTGFLASMQGAIDEIAVDAVDYDNITNVQKLRSVAIKSYKISPDRIPSNAKAEEIRDIIREYDPRLLKA